ncbi:MAG: hypothetical protein WCG30_01215 [Candidatus Saccharibacteria bacterium]
MKNINKNEKGSSIIELVVVLVVVLAISVVGYGIYRSQHKTTTTNTPSAVTSAPKNTVSKKGALGITEWKVILDYINTDATLSYSISSQNGNEAIISSSQLVAAFPACSTSATDSIGVGSIMRGKPGDIFSGNQTFQQYLSANKSGSLASTLGGYVYIYQSASKPCSGSATNMIQMNAETAAKSIFK